jgi:MFS family permease
MRKLSIARLSALMAFGFALTLLANTLEPAVLGQKVLQLVPDRRNTALGFTTFAGLIVAILVQPTIGVLSDGTRSRWGRRLPYFALGTLLVIVCLPLIALAPVFALVVIGVLLIQFASNTVQGPWQALIPDQVPESQRGQAAGIKATFDILAFIIGRLVAGQLVGQYPQWGQAAILAAVAVPSVVFLIALAITAVTAREGPEASERVAAGTVRQALARSFRIDLRAHPAFGWWFANRLLFWAAFIALQAFLLFFAIDVLRLQPDEAQRYISLLTVVLGTALVVVSIPAGWIADRVGRKPVVVASGLIAAAGTGAILFIRDINLVVVAATVIGLAIGMFVSANWALVTDIVPRNEAAHYLGIANIATASGSAIARFLGGALIDSINTALGSTSAGYITLYGIAAVLFLLSALVVLPLPTAPRSPLPPAA